MKTKEEDLKIKPQRSIGDGRQSLKPWVVDLSPAPLNIGSSVFP